MEYYTKLFNLSWTESWLVEALIVIFGALLLGLVVGKTMDFLNRDQQ
jgi:hypothetical protein